jgi:hypothetical protein
MKNRKVNDMKFFKDVFSDFDKNKRGLVNTRDNPYNYNYVKDLWSKTYLYELGYKFAYTMLTTDSHEQKQRFVDTNYHFSKKYLTIYPKSAILGEKQNKDFQKPIKKIGDISFEEDPNPESENIKNLKRLGPDNLTEEWIKENLTSQVDILRLENHYWISKDLVSKLGRLGTNLKVNDIILHIGT